MKVIAISGTPGTGKTTLARKLSKKIGYEYVDITKLIKKYKISEGYDRKRKCKIVDIKKLNSVLVDTINQYKKLSLKNKIKGLIIDSHLSHYLPRKYVDLCIITKCELKVLRNRLKRKRYGKEKIRENLDCEIFDVCLNEAEENKHNILVVDTTKGININSILARIK